MSVLAHHYYVDGSHNVPNKSVHTNCYWFLVVFVLHVAALVVKSIQYYFSTKVLADTVTVVKSPFFSTKLLVDTVAVVIAPFFWWSNNLFLVTNYY